MFRSHLTHALFHSNVNLFYFFLSTPHHFVTGPGIPRTCFHSILSLLQTSLLYRKDKAVLKVHPQLVQLSYKIMYNLCANPNTADSVLRYLRSSQDFLQQHMALFPFKTYDRGRKRTICASHRCVRVLNTVTLNFSYRIRVYGVDFENMRYRVTRHLQHGTYE